jgi:hypothetical protein
MVQIVNNIQVKDQNESKVPYRNLIEKNTISFSVNSLESNLRNKIEKNSILLGNISTNFRGLGVQKIINKDPTKSERIISGKEIQRYFIRNYHNYFIKKNSNLSEKKQEKLRHKKIMVQNIVAHVKDHIKIIATYDESGLLDLDTVNNIIVHDNEFDPKYILALLNSNLICYYTYNFIYSKAIRTMHFDNEYSGKIPIKKVLSETQVKITKLVDELLIDGKGLQEDRNTNNIELLKKKELIMEKVNIEIYKLYSLTDDEVAYVESTFS